MHIKDNFFNVLMFLLGLEPKTLGEYDLGWFSLAACLQACVILEFCINLV
jgi:hypothetical protein